MSASSDFIFSPNLRRLPHLVPKYRFWASLQITAVMAGATAVNIVILHQPPLARLTAVLIALAIALAWLRRPRTRQ